jgi:hypothetical protein
MSQRQIPLQLPRNVKASFCFMEANCRYSVTFLFYPCTGGLYYYLVSTRLPYAPWGFNMVHNSQATNFRNACVKYVHTCCRAGCAFTLFRWASLNVSGFNSDQVGKDRAQCIYMHPWAEHMYMHVLFYGGQYHSIPLFQKDQYERIRQLRWIVSPQLAHLV